MTWLNVTKSFPGFQMGLPLPCPSLEHLPTAKGTNTTRQAGCLCLFGDSSAGCQQSYLSVLSLTLWLCLQPSSNYSNVEEHQLTVGKHFSRQASASSCSVGIWVVAHPHQAPCPHPATPYPIPFPQPNACPVTAGVLYLPAQCKYFISWCYPTQSCSSLPAGQTKHALIEPRLCRNRWFDGVCWCRTRRGGHPAPGRPRK